MAMLDALRFEAIDLPESCAQLRADVRGFLAEERAGGRLRGGINADSSHSPEFSRKLGARGWIGMTWPKEYGGGERSAFERYVVSEELLAAGAPSSAHWVADRQSGPLLLRYGTEAQRQSILPRIVRGELSFCIGMSEPNSGSDLASVQTSATRADGGWRVNGTKLWTSWAHKSHYMISLVRTSKRGEDRHEGLSQFLIDMQSPGIEVRPIYNLAGEHNFNEVVLNEVFVPDAMVVGEIGDGWRQVTSELGYERSGPERFLNTFRLFVELVRAVGPNPNVHEARTVGRLAAHLITLRKMSISVAGMLQRGEAPNTAAAIVKDLGTNFEQEMPEAARALRPPDANETLDRAIMDAILSTPAYSIQGGSREILRVVIARGLGI